MAKILLGKLKLKIMALTRCSLICALLGVASAFQALHTGLRVPRVVSRRAGDVVDGDLTLDDMFEVGRHDLPAAPLLPRSLGLTCVFISPLSRCLMPQTRP